MMVRATTNDGRSTEGIRLNEDTFTIQIRDLARGFHSLSKSDLTELKKEFGKSPMPSYKTTLEAAETDDIVAYMASLRGGR